MRGKELSQTYSLSEEVVTERLCILGLERLQSYKDYLEICRLFIWSASHGRTKPPNLPVAGAGGRCHGRVGTERAAHNHSIAYNLTSQNFPEFCFTEICTSKLQKDCIAEKRERYVRSAVNVIDESPWGGAKRRRHGQVSKPFA